MKSNLLGNPWVHIAIAVAVLIWMVLIWVALKLLGRFG